MSILPQNFTAQSKASQTATTPEQAIEMLMAGNKRFTGGNMMNRDLGAQVSQTGTEGQAPYAVVLCCIDSRVPAETVFDQGVGDIFTARIAGNFVQADLIGSMEFACKLAGSKAIVVLGHTKCGAVKGAVTGIPAELNLVNLEHMLTHLKPAVDGAQSEPPRDATNPAFLQAVSDHNVTLTVQNIKDKSPVLKKMAEDGDIAIVGAMYNVETGEVTLH